MNEPTTIADLEAAGWVVMSTFRAYVPDRWGRPVRRTITTLKRDGCTRTVLR